MTSAIGEKRGGRATINQVVIPNIRAGRKALSMNLCRRATRINRSASGSERPIRIETMKKAPGQKADTSDPIVLPRGSTLLDAASSVHKDFAAKLKYSRIWGSGKHDGIMARRNHILEDGDIIELHLQSRG